MTEVRGLGARLLGARPSNVFVVRSTTQGIGIAATAHLAATMPHCPYIEFMPTDLCDSLLRKELVADELTISGGRISLPKKPGLGIEVNMEALRRFKVE